MYLHQLNLENYKCFYDRVSLNFEPGFNILLGANSSGKTAVLDAIDPNGSKFPHRSTLNSPYEGNYGNQEFRIDYSYSLKFEEIQKIFNYSKAIEIAFQRDSEPDFQSQISQLLDSQFIRLHSTGFNQSPSHKLFLSSDTDTIRQTNTAFHDRFSDTVIIDLKDKRLLASTQNTLNSHDVISVILHHIGIHKFAVNRKIQSSYQLTSETEFLLSDCSNLALCLANLNISRPSIFEEFNKLLSRVFSNIKAIQAPPINTQFNLKIHTHNTKFDRPDLTYDISQVGTGVGHVMSMIYVALTSKTPRIILLEEPNSFLHPRALKELLAILRDVGGQHQYIISTHSSDVLRAIEPSTVTLLENDGQQSQARQTYKDNMHELRSGLIDLGIRLTDLHGCDRVLWVEGQTEEAVFPYLLSHFFPDQAQGISVLKVYATGDFEAKKFDASKVAEIYQKLCTLNSLAPPMVAITLDREDRTQKYIEEIEKTPKNIIKFLPRRMLEDYFLDADAIKFVLREIATKAIDFNEVSKALSQAQLNISNQQKIKHTKDTYTHSAKVLKEVFWELAQTEYNKIKHGTLIAQYLLKHKQETLYELRDWFNKFIHLP